MKRPIIFIATTLLFLFFGAGTIFSQNEIDDWRKQMNAEFEAFKSQSEKEFRDFREQANAEFAAFLEKSWEGFSASPDIPAPKPLEPEKPVIVAPDKKPAADPIPFDKVTTLPTFEPRPQPVAPILPPTPDTPTPEPVHTGYAFQFYNTECKVRLDNNHRFSLPDASEQSVTQAWKTLSGKQYDTLLHDCLTLRDQLNLCDWGYLQLLKTLSEKFFGKTGNEAVLLQMFILTQSGYKVRIARTDNRLALLVPFQQTVYGHVYLNIGGVKYYVINKELKGQSFYICNQEFPKEHYFSWQTNQPKLAENLTTPKTFSSTLYQEIHAPIQTNQNLMDFYNNYPLTSEWNVYVRAGMSATVKQTLYPALQNAIAGKSKTEAADILLTFLQFAFDYQTDDKQFGYERPFFADENFFYPYNNCKDRAIMYCILVKELLGLEVVLLHYPNHLSTAVCFPENVDGDYLIVDGKKFIVCDPTYIGARIGMAMDNCKQAKAQVIKL
ncbi:MAG: hypothetical protein FWG84_02030 [Bacteroidales bacterium]|nr:hypothetical protein [Bacteroidales bacterium]